MLLGNRVHIQALGHAVRFEIGNKPAFNKVIVVAVIERSSTGKKVEVFPSRGAVKYGAFCSVEYVWEGSAVGPHVGFNFFKDRHMDGLQANHSYSEDNAGENCRI